MAPLNEQSRRQLKTKTENLFTRFVQIDELTGCWNWTGRKDARIGYGCLERVYKGKRYVLAHRLAYAVLIGDIPEGFTVDHLCKNRACVNPAHLEAVPFAENIRRRGGTSGADYNRKKTTCPRGHAYDVLRKRADGYFGRGCSICIAEGNRRRGAKRSAKNRAARIAAGLPVRNRKTSRRGGGHHV